MIQTPRPLWLKSVILQISIITMGLGVGTLLAGLFGMNVCGPPRDFNTDVLRKSFAHLAVNIALRRKWLRVLYYEWSVRRVRRSLLHVCHPKVWTPYHVCSDSQLLTDLVVTSRLHQIRKVGPLSDNQPPPTRRLSIPLPLRRRTTNNWL